MFYSCKKPIRYFPLRKLPPLELPRNAIMLHHVSLSNCRLREVKTSGRGGLQEVPMNVVNLLGCVMRLNNEKHLLCETDHERISLAVCKRNACCPGVMKVQKVHDVQTFLLLTFTKPSLSLSRFHKHFHHSAKKKRKYI